MDRNLPEQRLASSATNFCSNPSSGGSDLVNLLTSPRSSKPTQSPHFPKPYLTPSNKNADMSSANDDIWLNQEEDQGFKYSSPNSPLSKHVQSWEKRKEDLIKSAEKKTPDLRRLSIDGSMPTTNINIFMTTVIINLSLKIFCSRG